MGRCGGKSRPSALRAPTGLVMRLLRTANAASSGLRSEVTSLRQAIALLGPRPVAGLSESLSIARSLTLS